MKDTINNGNYKETRIRRIAKGTSVNVEKMLPDPWILAIILTVIVFILAFIFTEESPLTLVTYWAQGFAGFLAFSMQMVLILVTGSCLGTSPVFKKLTKFLARIPKSSWGPYVFIIVVCAILGFINWGLAFVLGALLAKQIAIENDKADYPLLVAAAFCGAYCGIFGLSNAPQLTVNTPGHFLESQVGLIPLTQTNLSIPSILTLIMITIGMAWVFKQMAPPLSESNTLAKLNLVDLFREEEESIERNRLQRLEEKKNWGIAQKLENSYLITAIIVVPGYIYIARYLYLRGFDLNLDFIIFAFLILGMTFHKTPISFIEGAKEAAKSVWSIILQFPFYGGMMALMSSSGLVTIIAGWFVSFSTPQSFPFWSYISGAVVNIFVPSGGGQWGVQGPFLVEAGLELGANMGQVVNAFAYGDIVTNYIQPFWALPMLSIAGLKVKDIWGYTAMGFLVYFVLASVSILLQGYFL